MKKIVSVFLCFVLVFLNGCSTTDPQDKAENTILDEYLSNISEFEVPVREFGKTTSLTHMGDSISIGILYPETEYDFLDSKISEWAEDLAEEYTEEAKSKVPHICNRRPAIRRVRIIIDNLFNRHRGE